MKHPLKLMFWGCMSAQGMGRLHLVEGHMNSYQYLEVLQHSVLPQSDDWFEGADWTFQQDYGSVPYTYENEKNL